MLDKYSYRVIWSEEDQEFVGLCAEFPSLSWLSKSQDAAFKGIRKLVVEALNEMENRHEVIPEPIAVKRFSGKFMVRVSPQLHRELVLEAKEAGISLNRYVSLKLAHLDNHAS